MVTKSRMLVLAGAALFLVVLQADVADADSSRYVRQTIVNGSDQAANDLHLLFHEEVVDARLKPKEQPPGRDAEGAVRPANKKVVEWAPPKFGEVAAGGVAYVDYCYFGDPVPLLQLEDCYWTYDGAPLTGFGVRGLPMAIEQKDFYGRLDWAAVIENDDTTAHSYHVDLYVGNDLSFYNLTDCFTPTGAWIGSHQFTLQPSESMVLVFDQPTPTGTYLLALGEGMRVGGDPLQDVYLLAAAAVPEPGALVLVVVGGLGWLVTAAQRRGRR